jgi:predicted RNase H-like HicB family nuclease
MEISAVMINDAKSNKYFGFIRQFPGICAQGETQQEVNEKINKFFKAYVERMQQAEIKFTENDIF